MKAVIDGKRYDTNTAQEIASWSSDYYGSDFRAERESLYRTIRGNWFLAGEGGPMTKYSESHGDMTGSGSGIIPLSSKEALQWLEDKGEIDAIETYFSMSVEDA